MPHLLIFKTNIETENAASEIGKLLKSNTSVINWHIDQEDIDNVLRIESSINNIKEIITTINQAGFICEELPD